MRSRTLAFAAACAVLGAACSGGGGGPAASTARVSGGIESGLVAFAGDQGIGVLDPSSGKAVIVAPLPPGGAFRAAGPVWAPGPGAGHPLIYFTIHDERPPERREAAGVLPYDWLYRADPFTGEIDPIAASYDPESEGPLGLAGNARYLALTVGCCATYEVDALDLTQTAGALKVLAKPPAQAPFFTQGAAPGSSPLIAVRAFGTGAWYWLNAEAGVLNPFPVALGADDGPIAVNPQGTQVAVALPDHGVVIRPINVALPVASPDGEAGATASASPPPSPTPVAPKRVNSKLPHPDGLAWSPDGRQLLVAVNGELQLYNASAPDGAGPVSRFTGNANVQGVSWSGPIAGKSFAMVRPSAGPLATVDMLLAATKLPPEIDNADARPRTRVYLWQFDSSKPSPISSIDDASPATLAKYPPIRAGVVFHHWAPYDRWMLLGGCYRYRVVIAGSIAPIASTFGLAGNEPCSTPKAPPSAKPK